MRKLDLAAAEIDLDAITLVDFVRRDQRGAFERVGNARPEAAEHAEIGLALGGELVALGGVVEDFCAALESLGAKTVLGMEMGEGQDQLALPPASSSRGCQHLLAIRRPHAGVDDERGLAAEHDADVGHQRARGRSGMT